MDDQGLGEIFFQVHCDLEREGPGSDSSTERALEVALAHLGELPRPVVVDMACGPGAQSLVLARKLPGARITAVDLHAPFLKQLEVRLGELEDDAFCAEDVRTVCADMKTWTPDGLVDLIWCEGAAYIMGVDRALERWRPWLSPGGIVALTEAVWLTESPHSDSVEMWEEYPAMRDIEGCLALFEEKGFQPLGSFVLPSSDWLEHYYNPMEQRIQALRARFTEAGNASALAELALHQREIDVYRAHGEDYGYLFVIAEKSDGWRGA